MSEAPQLPPIPGDEDFVPANQFDISENRKWQPNFPVVPRSDYGFPNQNNRCYRNVMVQMLLHFPAFGSWLVDYMSNHLEKEGVTESTSLCARVEGEPCLLCLLLALYAMYWDEYQTVQKADTGDVPENHYSKFFNQMWNRVWNVWDQGTGNHNGQQDATEFWPIFLGQIRNDVDPKIVGALANFDRLFYTQTTTMRTCTRSVKRILKRPCQASPRFTNSQTPMFNLPFPGEIAVMPTVGAGGFSPIAGRSFQPSTIQIAFLRYFQSTNMNAACPECECQRNECERLREPPELLLMHVNRIDFVRGQPQKIKRRVHFSKDIVLDKALFDQRLAQQGAGNPAADERYHYELFWVGMHQGETHNSGHYHCFAKGRRDWAFLDDLHTGLYNENQFTNFQPETQAYIFAYRRVVPGDEQEDPELVDPVRKVDDSAMDIDPKETPAEAQLPVVPGFSSNELGEERDKVGTLELRFTDSDGNILQSTDVVGIPYSSPAPADGKGLWRVELPGDKTGSMTLNWIDHTNNLVESCSMEGLLKDLMVARAKSQSRSRSGSRHSGSRHSGSRHSEKKEDDKKEDDKKEDDKPDDLPSTRSSLGRFKDIIKSPLKVGKGKKDKKKKSKKSKKGKKDEKCETDPKDPKDENC